MTQVLNDQRTRGVAYASSLLLGVSGSSRRVLTLLGLAMVVAILMSTEFLFQPFIWRNYGLADILPAWLSIARDRVVVAAVIAVLLALVGEPKLPGAWRFVPYVLAVTVGASIGEWLLSRLALQDDRQDVMSLCGRILRWSVVGGAIAIMVHVWRSGADLAAAAEENRIQETQAVRLAASSQLEMLRRQIEPHFLFNTLATIRRLHETNPEQGQHVLARLFHYMSATLSEATNRTSTLGDEIDLVIAYLDVCASRMTGRLIVRTEVKAELRSLDFPPLVLATLAENAIKHGVFPLNGGVITLLARRIGSMVEVTLADDGVGFSGDGGGGLGLANIVERLRLLYGAGAQFELQANVPRGVRGVVRIPASQRDDR